ncbi:MAG: CYTH domain-containing protein [Acidobacteria bacterium]|nr:CYTH domain-containing protein [Acidobacteriota bacterium]
MTEIERKFLVRELPEGLESYPSKEIVQGYLAVVEEQVEVRVRRKAELFLLTVKRPLPGDRGLARDEIEIEISREQFEALWPATAGRRVEKRRYAVPVEGGVADVDVYGGDLEGLVTAEVEVPTLEAARAFVPPAWLGTEVTADGRYKNRNLALDGRPPQEPAVDGAREGGPA